MTILTVTIVAEYVERDNTIGKFIFPPKYQYYKEF